MNPRIYIGALDEATYTMSLTENASFPLANLSTYIATDLWKSSANTNGQTLKIDFGAARPRDYCILEGHNFSGMTTVSLQAATDSAYTSPVTIVTSLVGSNANPLKFEFTSVNYRYWRILFSDTNTTTPELGQIFIGQAVNFSQHYDWGLKPKAEDHESVTTHTVLSGLRRAVKVYGGRARYAFGWKNVGDTTLEKIRFWLHKVQGNFAPFWFYDHQDDNYYGRLTQGFHPSTVHNYKIGDSAPFEMEAQAVGTISYGQQTGAMAVTLDGSADYASKSSPVNLDMNGSELITNTGFESITGTPDDGITDIFPGWANNATGGNLDATATAHSGSYALKINRTGGGGLGIFQQINVTPNGKYTLEFWTRGDGTYAGEYYVYDPTNGVFIISQATTGVTGTTYTKIVKNFVIPSDCSYIQIGFESNSANPSSCYFDDASLTQAYDFTILAWVNFDTNAITQYPINKYDGSIGYLLGFNVNGILSEIYDGTNYAVTGYTPFATGSWGLLALIADRDGNLSNSVNGGAFTSTSMATVGKITNSGALGIGAIVSGASNKVDGYIGEVQVIRGYAMTAAQIANIYNNTGIERNYEFLTESSGQKVVAHYRWRGTSDANFLKDETGYNNLTGTSIDQQGNQSIGTYRTRDLG